MKYFRKIPVYLNILGDYFGLDPETRAFKKYLASRFTENEKSNKVILVESQQWSTNQIALSYFLPLLRKEKNSELVAYRMMKIDRLSKLKQILRHKFSVLPKMGCKKFLLVPFRRQLEANKLVLHVETAEELETFEFHGVLIGDLIYDRYLNVSRQHTLDLKDPLFLETFQECVQYFEFWESYFLTHDVQAVCVSHSVYHFAIPARLAVKRNIEAFQVSAESIFRLTILNPQAFETSECLKQKFNFLPKMQKESGMSEAINRINHRLKGGYSTDMPWSSGIAFQEPLTGITKATMKNGKLKVLIACHHFYDAPHFHGRAFYPDFFLWLKRLNELSYEVDYDWYVKPHPDAKGAKLEVLEEFVLASNGFHLLSETTSHRELLDQGIDVALTVYGTIALEYAAMDKLVINASNNNLSSGYNFAVSPKNREDYEHLILSLGQFSHSINIDEVYQYYFMRHIYTWSNWIFKDYGLFVFELGSYRNSVSKSAYAYFL